MFGSLGAPELIIIGLIVILLFGVGKLSGLGKDLGSSVKEFRRAVKDEDKDEAPPQQMHSVAPPPPQQQVPPPQQHTPAPPSSNSETKSNIF